MNGGGGERFREETERKWPYQFSLVMELENAGVRKNTSQDSGGSSNGNCVTKGDDGGDNGSDSSNGDGKVRSGQWQGTTP
jgi:hypothetical protein